MIPRDAISIDLAAWLEDEAAVPVPAALRERALAAAPSRQPRPGLLAPFGSHWVTESPMADAPLPRRVGLPAVGAISPILLLLIALALVGAAMFIGSRQIQQPPTPGRLAYELGGAIYLADEDGGNPVRVALGGLAAGAIWAPDGHHFLFHSDGAQISDRDGRVIASIENNPGFNGYPTWSPDSSRLQAWTHGFTRISIYGLDGSLQTTLSLPEGYRRLREYLAVWSPDGQSVWVRIARSSGASEGEAWELPIDGSAPRQATGALALMARDVAFAPDGTHIAFWGLPGDADDRLLYVANPDGTEIRPAVRADDSTEGQGLLPVWSPSGQRLAYFVWVDSASGEVDVKVVDVATGTAQTLIAALRYGAWPPYSWSADGDRVLFSSDGGVRAPGLWTVSADGGDATLLVEGAKNGEWQPASWAGTRR